MKYQVEQINKIKQKFARKNSNFSINAELMEIQTLKDTAHYLM